MALCFFCFLVAAFSNRLMVLDAALNDIGSVSFCSGESGIIEWSYTDAGNISVVKWYKDGTQVMFQTSGIVTVIDPKVELDNVTNAALKVVTVDSSSAGIYSCNVVYNAGTSPTDGDEATIFVVDEPPDPPTSMCTGSGSSRECKCSTSKHGTPAVDVLIKVDGVLTTTDTATIENNGDCCLDGIAVNCMPENINKNVPYCVPIPVDNNTSDNGTKIGKVVGGTIGGVAFLGLCCGAFVYGRKKKPNKPRGCRYDLTTQILRWKPPKEVPILPTKNVTKYHIEIQKDQLTQEIDGLRNTNGKLNNHGWVDITKKVDTMDKDQQKDPQKDPQPSWRIDRLPAGKAYNFRVYAENKNGLSSAANSKTGGNVDKGDSACCRPNNSILPICAGDDQDLSYEIKPSHRPRGGDDRHQFDEPKSNTTKTDEAGSFVSGKDIKVDTGGILRAQPPLPDIKSGKKKTRGLSANINDSDINPSYERMPRLTPIGQESQPGWEEKADRSEDGKEKKKKRKSKDKERDSNVTESADL